MVIWLFTVLIVLIFFIVDGIPMYLDRQWKSFWVYTLMMLIILVMIYLKQIADIPFPSPAEPMKEALIAIFGKQ